MPDNQTVAQDQEIHYPGLPSEDSLKESAYLVSRGVRALAIVGSCDYKDASQVRHTLLTKGQAGVVPFAVPDGNGGAVCGYASHAWAVDLLAWCKNNAIPAIHHDRILGLLLGYTPDAIRSFEELSVAGGVP